jgi:hypothetical protein
MKQVVAGWILGLGLVIACGDDASPAGQASPAATYDYIDLSEGTVSPSPSQLALLDDGSVTFDEYEAAVLATVQCLKDAGIQVVDEPRLDLSGTRYVYRYFAGFSDAEFEEVRLSYQECYTLHQAVVDVEWAKLTAPPQGRLQEALTSLASCLADAGFEVPTQISDSDFANLLAQDPITFNTCLERVTEQFGIPFVIK